jgi:hypothetical protein
MEREKSQSFQVTVIREGNYDRLYVNHPSLRQRIRKRIGRDISGNSENIKFRLNHGLDSHFVDNAITPKSVGDFIEDFISFRLKVEGTIFVHFNDFIEWKNTTVNKNTKNRLVKSTITSYGSARRLFEEYLTKKGKPPYPSVINLETLNNFYYAVKGQHNYKVKLHRRIKAYITYLEEKKGFQFDPSYKSSTFVEQYDNQDPEENDIALTATDVQKLIMLRKKLSSGDIDIPMYSVNSRISVNIQRQQYNLKVGNLMRCLDCFLFMISTGMYHADVMKTKITLTKNGDLLHLKYRRAKNGSLCKAIPIKNDEVFIAKEIMNQYKIRSGMNFPLNLSNTHFNKHLELISDLAGLGFKLNNRQARKSFASILYFERQMPVHLLQIMLGHKNVSNTQHYLRIDDENLAREINRIMYGNI